MDFNGVISGFLAKNDVAAACNVAAKAWQDGVRDPESLKLIGKACFMGGNLAVAEQALAALAAHLPDDADVCNQLASVLVRLNRNGEAVAWFDKALALNPDHKIARRNASVLKLKLFGREADVVALRQLVTEHPEWLDPALQLGSYLIDRGRVREACELMVPIVDRHPTDWRAVYTLGLALEDMKMHDLAVEAYERAHALAPDEVLPTYPLLYCRIRQNDYPRIRALLPKVIEGVNRGVSGFAGMRALMATDDPAWHFKAIKMANDRNMAGGGGGAPLDRTVKLPNPQGKIRLGLFGNDYCNHPVGYGIVELLECIDKSRFEVFVYSYGNEKDDAMRLRIKAAVDGWFETGNLSDRDTAQLIASHGIDVLMDQKGVTRDPRPAVYAWHPAPVQLNCLAVSTSARPEWNYALVDERIVPPSEAPNWSETLVYMPHCIQPRDRKQAVAEPKTRAEYGLPETGTVFVSFNQSKKMGEPLMVRWAQILREVPDSVLWLKSFEDNLPQVAPNIKAFFATQGIAPERIIVAGQMPSKEDHLARYKVADLALDTWPYASHTTCGDALLAGCPVICNPGRGFVARMSLSMLHAVGMQELIVQDWDAYVALAVKLAKNPDELARVKAKLVANLPASPLFDTPRYARNFERALTMMVERTRAGLKPEMMWVREEDVAAAA